MKKKSFFNGISVKMALSIVALSGALLTGCYKDDGLDADAPVGEIVLPEATYTLTGTVVDATTLQNISLKTGDYIKVGDAAVQGTDGSFTQAVKSGAIAIKVKVAGYNDGAEVTRNVTIAEVKRGQAVVYTQTIALIKDGATQKVAQYNIKLQAFGGKDFAQLASENFKAELKNAEGDVQPYDKGYANLTYGAYVLTVSDAAETPTMKSFTTDIYLNKVYLHVGEKENISVVVSAFLPAIDAVDQSTIFSADFTNQANGAYFNVTRAWLMEGGKVQLGVVTNTSHAEFKIAERKANTSYKLYYQYTMTDGSTVVTKSHVYGANETSFPGVVDLTNAGSIGIIPGQPNQIPGGDDATIEKDVKVTMPDGTVVDIADVNVNIQRLSGEEVSEDATARVYEGTPDGISFSKPLAITFKDAWKGQLGTMNLVYAKNGKWNTISEGDVKLSGDTYTMNVNHFSKFKAAVPYTALKGVSSFPKDSTVTTVGQKNDTDKALVVKYNYKVASGSEFTPSIQQAVADQGFIGSAAELVGTIIRDSLSQVGYLGEGITFEPAEYTYSVAPWTCLEEFSFSQQYEKVDYTFTVNGKAITLSVKAAISVTVNEPKTYFFGHGHGHSHGHGNNDLAGGGIIDAE